MGIFPSGETCSPHGMEEQQIGQCVGAVNIMLRMLSPCPWNPGGLEGPEGQESAGKGTTPSS